MFGPVAHWLDAQIRIDGSSEFDRALLRERFTTLKQQMPWLHGMLAASLIGLIVALHAQPLTSLAPALVLFGIIITRACLLPRVLAAEISTKAIKLELRKTFITACLFFLVCLAWHLSLFYSLSGEDSADVATFAGLAAIGASTGLSTFPAAARVPIVVGALPFAALLIGAPQPFHQAIGLTLLVVLVVRLRLLNVQDKIFERLVRSRSAVEVEKRKAVKAEQDAVAEQRRVAAIANTDSLTGLINRRGFVAALDAVPATDRRDLALILVDLDGFKAINDTFGHLTGDAILIEVSRRLQRLARRIELVARLGGDEFALLCECATPAEAMVVAKRTIAKLSAPYWVEGRLMRISACAGVSFQRDDNVVDAVRRADIALYDAKRRRRGGASLFSADMERVVQRRTSIEQALRKPGVAADIQLSFQPIFQLDSMALTSFEALARWQHPELGWIAPSEFIPISEQISVLEDITSSLLSSAAAAAGDWPREVRLSFNLSPVELCSPGTAARVLTTIAHQRLEPTRLQIEITETALLGDFDAARENLSQLRDRGVQIVLDDFGAGYSSVSYLREMNFDIVKLDGSLISSTPQGGSGLALLQGVLALCRAMGHSCVAEHIETREQLQVLRGLGCHYGQGFVLCQPVSRTEAATIAAGEDHARMNVAERGFQVVGGPSRKVQAS